MFPSPLKPGSAMSDMTLTKILRSAGLAERATVHGFRSSFKNWTLEKTDTPWAVSEAALAHILGNSTEQAYARSDLFERRRALMQLWADYLAGQPQGKSDLRNPIKGVPVIQGHVQAALGGPNSPLGL